MIRDGGPYWQGGSRRHQERLFRPRRNQQSQEQRKDSVALNSPTEFTFSDGLEYRVIPFRFYGAEVPPNRRGRRQILSGIARGMGSRGTLSFRRDDKSVIDFLVREEIIIFDTRYVIFGG